METEGLARAKINLCLHVTGRRADGYHLLDSLVVFAGVGDRISCSPADGLNLHINGPEGSGLTADDSNLVLRAARAFDAPQGARLVLDKNLPVASGIGGGSADAAATLLALARLWQRPLPDAARILALGADVPVCLAGVATRMQGVGERLTPLASLPNAWLVLANPRVPVSTPAVFAALERRDNPPLPAQIPRFVDLPEMAGWLISQRNDLETPACAIAPVIAEVKQALASQPDCLLARMSGSGATCFGMFAAEQAAGRAAATLSGKHPGWWIAAAPMQQTPA